MAIWWQSEKPKENIQGKKHYGGIFFSIKQIHYSKRNLTIIRKPFPRLYWPVDNLQENLSLLMNILTLKLHILLAQMMHMRPQLEPQIDKILLEICTPQ